GSPSPVVGSPSPVVGSPSPEVVSSMPDIQKPPTQTRSPGQYRPPMQAGGMPISSPPSSELVHEGSAIRAMNQARRRAIDIYPTLHLVLARALARRRADQALRRRSKPASTSNARPIAPAGR